MLPGLRRLRDRFDAILLDLDGTLLDGRSRITPRTRRAVGALVDVGFRVILCSGRSAAGMRAIHRELDLEEPFVAYNGHWIGPRDGYPTHVRLIPDAIAGCLRAAEKHARFAFRHADERKYTLLSDHPDHRRIAAWYERVVETHVPADLPLTGLMRVTMFFEHEAEIERAWNAMTELARDSLGRFVVPLSVFPPYEHSNLLLCEVQIRSAGKAEAYPWLEEAYGIVAARTIAVGDHVNDASMLAGAGLAVVPGNVAPSVRPLADLVIAPNTDEGFAAWIESGAPIRNGDSP